MKLKELNNLDLSQYVVTRLTVEETEINSKKKVNLDLLKSVDIDEVKMLFLQEVYTIVGIINEIIDDSGNSYDKAMDYGNLGFDTFNTLSKDLVESFGESNKIKLYTLNKSVEVNNIDLTLDYSLKLSIYVNEFTLDEMNKMIIKLLKLLDSKY